ncbi:MAG: efflux RND transporter periplasmic adaptor subunit [Rikenellaceae bacterium]
MRIKLSIYLAAVFAVLSCTSTPQIEKSVRKVKCETLQATGVNSLSRDYSGRIEAVADVNLSFRVAGVVDRVVAREGGFVRKDQVVALLDSRDYALQLAATEAEYEAVKGEVERVIELYKEQSVSQNDYEKAVSGLKQITAKLEAHRNALGDCELKAPFDGYIQTVKFSRGEALAAGMPVVSFVSAGAPKITINIPVSEYLRRGELLSATATLQSYPDLEFNLKPIGVSYKASLNQMYESHFVVEPQGGVSPAPGVLAMVKLHYRDDAVVLSLPTAAIVERDGDSYVWVVDGGVAKLRGVVVAQILSSGRAAIKIGVAAGDVVITAGVANLKEGESVEPLAEPTKSNVGNIL